MIRTDRARKMLLAVSTVAIGCAMTVGSGIAGGWGKGPSWKQAKKDTGKVVKNVKKAIVKAVDDTAQTINKANNDFHAQTRRDFDNINKFLEGAEKEFCSLMTAGGSDRGEASCGVSGGAGVSTDGESGQPYIYDPAAPEERYYISEKELTVPAVGNFQMGGATELQDWERREGERLKLFVAPGDTLGLPWAYAASETKFANGTGEIRFPNGGFLSLRIDKKYPGGVRLHGGIDYVNKIGDAIFAPVSGTITRVIQPGREGLTGLEIRTDRGYTAQVLYVAPSAELARALSRKERPTVKAGQAIGTAQDLHAEVTRDGKRVPVYPLSVPQHVHVTLKDSNGRFVSPDGQTVVVMRKGNKPIVESKQGN